MKQAWYNANTHLVELRGLKNEATGSYINSAATVTADVFDVTANAVVTGSSVSMSYVASSDGVWRGTLPSTLALLSSGTYKLRVSADAGGIKGYWTPELVVKTRE